MPGKHKKTTIAPPTESCSEGKKDDTGKLRWDLVPFGPLEEVVRVYQHGCTKYDDWNWEKGLTYSRMFAAAMRHLGRWWWRSEMYDSESGCHHLACVTFYMLGLMHFDMSNRAGLDDRRGI